MNVFFSLIGILAGIVLLFAGYRIARYAIALWGFLAGLSLGGAVISALENTPFLGTSLGIVVGLAAGIVLAIIAMAIFSLAVVVLVGSLGYWIGSSFILFLGFNHGLISVLVGIALGIAAAILAIIFNATKIVIIVATGLSGGIALIGSLLLAFNHIPLNSFSYHAARISIGNSAFYSLLALLLAIVGIVFQFRTTANYTASNENYIGRHTTHPSSQH